MSSEPKAPQTAASRATRLTILCRGATAANQKARFSSDDPLLPKEHKRLTMLSQSLRRFDMVLHAPEPAAAQTAAAFSAVAAPSPALRDIAYGTWNDRTVAHVAEQSPADLHRWMTDPSSAPHGGEAFGAAQVRAAAWLESLHSSGGNTLAVTHAILLKLLLLNVISAPLTSVWQLDVEPLGVLSLTSDGRRWALRGFGTELQNA